MNDEIFSDERFLRSSDIFFESFEGISRSRIDTEWKFSETVQQALLLPLQYFLLTIITILLLAYLTWMYWTRRYHFLPQPKSYPWIGNALSIPTDPNELFKFARKYAGEYNHLYCLWFGPVPVIFASTVEYSKTVLSSNTLIKKSNLYRFVEDWLSKGLLTSTGPKWKKRRRLITPSFHFGILLDFVSIFEENAQKLCFKLQEIAASGNPIDVQTPVSLAKLDVICETAMGVKINAQDSSDSEYSQAIKVISSLIQVRQKNPLFWSDIIFKFTNAGKLYFKTLDVLHNFTIDVINQSIERRKTKKTIDNKKKKVFLEMLLDLYDKGEIDIKGICEEVDTFMFEGHDTTSVGLSWTLYELGRHPDTQSKLYEEVKNADLSLPIAERVKSIKYLDCVLKEGLRLHPPVPIFARTTEEDVIIDNNIVPKGTEIGINVYDLHRNPLYWENPNEFIPERFSDEQNSSKRNPFCYIPFSAGARNCVGQRFAVLEEKIFLYHLISMYELKAVQDYNTDVKSCMEIIHKSENGLFIELSTR